MNFLKYWQPYLLMFQGYQISKSSKFSLDTINEATSCGLPAKARGIENGPFLFITEVRNFLSKPH